MNMSGDPGRSSETLPRQESEIERADRRFVDLLQELRVAQAGVQFLFAFLLTLAFTQRFGQVTEFQRWLYVVTLLITVLSSTLLIGPVALHRMLYRRGLKPRVVRGSDRMARAGLALLALAINGAVLLILDVVIGTAFAVVATGVSLVWFGLLWYVVPWLVARRRERLMPP
jgi:hypothetical protein